jgi:hypothetical protein
VKLTKDDIKMCSYGKGEGDLFIPLSRLREIIRYLGQCAYEEKGVIVIDYENIDELFGEILKEGDVEVEK